MLIIADLHVHVYPGYSYREVLLDFFSRIQQFARQRGVGSSDVLGIIALTERADCNFFEQLSAPTVGWLSDLNPTPRENCIQLENQGNKLLVFPGRQLNTGERIEILSLGSDQRIPSGLSLEETFSRIRAEQGIPVINWAPGKWFFKRGAIIREFINSSKDVLVLCDTSLRPRGYPEPLLMKFARAQGHKIIFGSDPLPAIEEQSCIGSYLSLYSRDFNLQQPGVSFKDLLLQESAQAEGQRSTLIELYRRLRRYYATNKGMEGN